MRDPARFSRILGLCKILQDSQEHNLMEDLKESENISKIKMLEMFCGYYFVGNKVLQEFARFARFLGEMIILIKWRILIT